VLTGELRNQIDGIWNDFWSGGLANPLQVASRGEFHHVRDFIGEQMRGTPRVLTVERG
jgi:hypothetical protein